MPDRHALLSASSSKQWLNCPPSARLQEQFPNESSVYAAEGTFAHEVCEYKVRKYLKERVKRPQSEEYYTEEIDQITDVYAEFVISIIEEMKRNGCEPLVMVEERVDYTHIAPSGFGTADMLIVGKDENGNGVLHIADFKTGQGVFVDADHNSQMMLYALGGLAAYGYIYDIKTVRMSIIQPRLDNISTFEQRAGDWCRFCRAKPVCKACKDEALSLCREEFLDLDEGAFNEGAFSDESVLSDGIRAYPDDNIENCESCENGTVPVFKQPGLVPLTELAQILPALNRISSWIESVFAFVRLLREEAKEYLQTQRLSLIRLWLTVIQTFTSSSSSA